VATDTTVERTSMPNSTQPVMHGIEHVGITVPDLEAASRFFAQAFGAEILFDNITRDAPVQGEHLAAMFGVPAATRAVASRFLRLGNGPGVELFEIVASEQRPAARPNDYGLQHIAIYVDDVAAAGERFVAAGGRMRAGLNPLVRHEAGLRNAFWYGVTPWGTSIELISSPSPQAYEESTPARRWRPDR